MTNDRPAEAIAIRWLREGRPFLGMVGWAVEGHEHRSIDDFVEDFDDLAADPFSYPIRHLKIR